MTKQSKGVRRCVVLRWVAGARERCGSAGQMLARSRNFFRIHLACGNKFEPAMTASTNMAVIKISAMEFRANAVIPKDNRRYRDHEWERHSRRASAPMNKMDTVIQLCLSKSDKAKTNSMKVGRMVCEAAQISLSLGSTNTKETVQRKNAGIRKAIVLK